MFSQGMFTLLYTIENLSCRNRCERLDTKCSMIFPFVEFSFPQGGVNYAFTSKYFKEKKQRGVNLKFHGELYLFSTFMLYLRII